MGELFNTGNVQRLPEEGTYRLGDLSVAHEVDVTSATGSKDEKHASGSYGKTSDVLGSVVHTFVRN